MIEKQQVELSELKKKLQSDPAYHTLEYVEKKLEKKLDEFQEKMLTTIKQECNTAVKSYAWVTKFSSDSTNNSTENIKEAVRVARKEEIADNQAKLNGQKILLFTELKNHRRIRRETRNGSRISSKNFVSKST